MNIAIFDSGIGGLSVLYQARRMLPEAHFLYYADEDHVPYGEKTREQILTYTDEAVRFLIDRGADAIVLACNTATSAAAATLRDRYPLPIIGMEPKEMHRRGRINVVEGKNFLILIDLLAGNFPAGDLAKQAVIILHKTSSRFGF